jgi:hypothetical protein
MDLDSYSAKKKTWIRIRTEFIWIRNTAFCVWPCERFALLFYAPLEMVSHPSMTTNQISPFSTPPPQKKKICRLAAS